MRRLSFCPLTCKDLIFENVFYDRKHGIYYLIDPEWVFDFPIPSSFIIWRGIYDFYCKTEKAEAFFTQLDLLAKFGISQNDVLTFMQWNDSFTYKFVGAQRLDRYSKLRIYASMDYLIDLYYRENTIDCSLFLDYGEGFNEKDKLHTRALLINQEFSVTFNICNYTNVKAMRFDPIEGFACQCQVCSNECSLEPLNVAYKRDSFDVFLTDDPIYLVKPYSYKINSITISGKLVKLTHSKLIKELKFNLLE